MESAENKIGNAAEQLLLFCYHYDPSTGTYGLLFKDHAIAAVATILGRGLMGLFFCGEIKWRPRGLKDRKELE